MKKTHLSMSACFLLLIFFLIPSCEDDKEGLETISLQVGETSESGGIIFYDKGEHTNGWRYIEVTPGDIGAEIEWGCFNTPIVEARNLDIGMGKENSEAITSFHDTLDNYYSNPLVCSDESNGTVAAKVAMDLSMNGFDDWFLPSEKEAYLIYEVLHLNNIGNFDEDSLYWTSTEHDDNTATTMDFSTGDQGWNCKQCSYDVKIRAIRYF